MFRLSSSTGTIKDKNQSIKDEISVYVQRRATARSNLLSSVKKSWDEFEYVGSHQRTMNMNKLFQTRLARENLCV